MLIAAAASVPSPNYPDISLFAGGASLFILASQPEVMRWPTPTPPREELVLNILGTRVILPTDPDYDIDRLHDFVQEACGTRGSRGCVF